VDDRVLRPLKGTKPHFREWYLGLVRSQGHPDISQNLIYLQIRCGVKPSVDKGWYVLCSLDYLNWSRQRKVVPIALSIKKEKVIRVQMVSNMTRNSPQSKLEILKKDFWYFIRRLLTHAGIFMRPF
jgi:hypothetical protein